jgi:hypothetical protein
LRTRRQITFLVIALAMLASGCMPKIENDDPIQALNLTHIIEQDGANAHIVMSGACPANTHSVRVAVNSEKYTNVALRNSLTEGSGVPVGECKNGDLTIVYPVPNPGKKRQIQFEIRTRSHDGRSSRPFYMSVNYAFPLSPVPGFAITSGGGVITGDGIKMHSSAGAPVSGIAVEGDDFTLRQGIHGVLFEPL